MMFSYKLKYENILNENKEGFRFTSHNIPVVKYMSNLLLIMQEEHSEEEVGAGEVIPQAILHQKVN